MLPLFLQKYGQEMSIFLYFPSDPCLVPETSMNSKNATFQLDDSKSSPIEKLGWAVLSGEQMSKGLPSSLLNDEQMSNWLGVEHQPVGCVSFW